MLKKALWGWPAHGRHRRFTKTGLVMRMTVVLLCAAFMNVSAEVRSQQITFSGKDIPVSTILQEVEKLTGYAVTYAKGVLAGTSPVTIQAQNMPLRDFLAQVLSDQPVQFSIEYKTIFLWRKQPSGQQRPKESFAATPITGRVADEHGNPLVGASISVKNGKLSAITNAAGMFSVAVNAGDVLVISYVGFEEKEIKITASMLTAPVKPLAITLAQKTEALDGVVVHTGYQELPQERATGSFVKVDRGSINRSVGPNILDRLEGMVGGMQFNRHPLAQEKITIRGRTTIFANPNVLVVVDGFPYDGPLDHLNPNDVESITVLKDAAAASIWGVRAGNGVVVIETKKGKANTRARLSVGSMVNIGARPDLFAESRITAADFIRWETWLFDNDYYNSTINSVNKSAISPAVEILWQKREGLITDDEAQQQLDALGKIDVRHDMMKYMYQNNIQQQYFINLSGGADRISYFVSANYDKNLANERGNDNERITIHSNTIYRPVKKLELTAGVNYIRTNANNNSPLFNLRPYFYERLVDENGNPASIVQNYRMRWITAPEQQRVLDWQFRPIEEIDLRNDATTGSDTRMNLGMNYTLWPGLKAEARYQYQQFNRSRRNYQSQDVYSTRDQINARSTVNPDGSITRPFLGGILDLENYTLVIQSFRAQLGFNREWHEKHSIAAIGGIESREVKTIGNTNRLYGYDDEYGTFTTINFEKRWPLYFNPNSSSALPNRESVSATLNRYISYYANASYTFLGRYTVSASARSDASNLFGVNTNQKRVPLWSTGVSWDIGRENFYRVNAIPYLRLRMTYGYSGNIREIASAYLTTSFANSTLNRIPYASVMNPPNPDLRWERVSTFNAGIDFRGLNNRISGSIEWYQKNGKDLFGNVPLAPSGGRTSFNANSANTRVTGADLILNTVNIDGSIRWETSFLFSIAKEKVTKYLLETTNMASLLNNNTAFFGMYPVEGRPMLGLYSYRWAGLDPETGAPRGYLNGEPSTNYSALISGLTIDDLVYHGPFAAPVFGSIRNTITWKGFHLSANILFKFGHYFRRESVTYVNLRHGDYYKRWQKPGDEQFTDVPSDPQVLPFNYTRQTFYSNSEATAEKADHIRLNDVRLGYTLNAALLQKTGLKGAEFSIYARNLGLIWKANRAGLDPDSPVIPVPKSIAFSLRLDL